MSRYHRWDSEPYETRKATVVPSLMVCETCHATVPEDETDEHDQWHALNDNPLTAVLGGI